MLRGFLDGASVLHLPVVVMVLFLAFFLAVVWRVTRRSRRATYHQMARLPLDGDAGERIHR